MRATAPQQAHWDVPVNQNGRNWVLFGVTAPIVLILAAISFWAMPDHRGLVWLGLYTIPSHMFVSPFPHEPVLLFHAKYNPALGCALASIAGCLVAGIWDYWLFIPLVHHPRLRAKYIDNKLYNHSVRFFRKWPFWALVAAGLTPVPFYPIKFLSLADGYPLRKYLAALIVGRTPRYYFIAYVGYVLKLPNWSLLVLAAALLVIALYKRRSVK